MTSAHDECSVLLTNPPTTTTAPNAQAHFNFAPTAYH